MDSLNPYNPFLNRKKGSPYSQEQLDYICQLVQQGWNANRISQVYDLSRDSIRKRIQSGNWKAGKNNRNNALSNDELKEIQKEVEEKILSLEEISRKHQISLEGLFNRIKNKKWERTKKKNSYCFNEKYFDNIENEHQAYWLGFLMADGYILSKRNREERQKESQSFGFAISMKDHEIFDYFKEDLQAENPINCYTNTSTSFPSGIPYGRILLTSQYTVDRLKFLGIVENKTFLTSFPKNLNRSLIPAFIRGYSDGDGSVIIDKNNKYAWNITGTKELLMSFQEFFRTNIKLSQRFPERNNNNYTLKYEGNIQVPRLLDIIYRNQTICLKRKYNKYAEMQGNKCAMGLPAQLSL